MRRIIKANLTFLVIISWCFIADDLPAQAHGSSVTQGAEVQVPAGTKFFGLGLLKKSTNNPCDTAIRRDSELFWGCYSSVTEEVVADNGVQIRLADGKFFLEKDLTDSSDREYDELMLIVDVLPKLVSFACFPELPIDRVRLPISRELESADIVYLGEVNKTLFPDDSVVGWELSALEVYRNLNGFCQDYFCEFADVRTNPKFWDCNKAALRETLWVSEHGIRVILDAGKFFFEQSVNDQKVQSLDLAITSFGWQASKLISDIACHPTEGLVDVALRDRNGLPKSLVFGVTNKVVFEANKNTLRLEIDAYEVYTNPMATESCF